MGRPPWHELRKKRPRGESKKTPAMRRRDRGWSWRKKALRVLPTMRLMPKRARRARRKKRYRSSGGIVKPTAQGAAPEAEQPEQEEAWSRGFLEPELIEGSQLANDDIERG